MGVHHLEAVGIEMINPGCVVRLRTFHGVALNSIVVQVLVPHSSTMVYVVFLVAVSSVIWWIDIVSLLLFGGWV